MNYDATRLTQELMEAGLPINGCDSSGNIAWASEPTEQQMAEALELLSMHDPTGSDMEDAENRSWAQAVNLGWDQLTAEELNEVQRRMFERVFQAEIQSEPAQ